MKALLVLSIFVLSNSTLAANIKLEEINTYQREDFNRDITPCDKLAGHPSDPEKVTDGVTQADMDLDAAIAACTKAVKADPKNPRLNYQLGRAYGYSGRHAESDQYRNAALKAGYPQSLFVLGYIRLNGWDGRPVDACYGGALVKKSAQAGRLAGLIAFPHYFISGKFEACEALSKTHADEMKGFLIKAKERKLDFYQGLLVERLERNLAEQTQ